MGWWGMRLLHSSLCHNMKVVLNIITASNVNLTSLTV